MSGKHIPVCVCVRCACVQTRHAPGYVVQHLCECVLILVVSSSSSSSSSAWLCHDIHVNVIYKSLIFLRCDCQTLSVKRLSGLASILHIAHSETRQCIWIKTETEKLLGAGDIGGIIGWLVRGPQCMQVSVGGAFIMERILLISLYRSIMSIFIRSQMKFIETFKRRGIIYVQGLY